MVFLIRFEKLNVNISLEVTAWETNNKMPSGHVEAIIDGVVVAESDTYELVEGNVYFPPSSVKSEYFSKTDLHTHCGWKGDASYYTIKVGGMSSNEAADGNNERQTT